MFPYNGKACIGRHAGHVHMISLLTMLLTHTLYVATSVCLKAPPAAYNCETIQHRGQSQSLGSGALYHAPVVIVVVAGVETRARIMMLKSISGFVPLQGSCLISTMQYRP
jgi:hypothetical protein